MLNKYKIDELKFKGFCIIRYNGAKLTLKYSELEDFNKFLMN